MMAAGYRERDVIAGAVAGGGEEIAALNGCVGILCEGLSLDCLGPCLPSDV